MGKVKKELLLKINSADNKCKENLLRIAADEIFENNEELFDLVLSQSSIHSQNIIYDAIKTGTSKETINKLVFYSNGFTKQKRILKYDKLTYKIEDEVIYIDMLNLEDDYVENSLYKEFTRNNIKNRNEYFRFKTKYKTLSKLKNALFNEDNKELTEEDYYALKEKRIIKDNVLSGVKETLRNFGFLGIDIPRVNAKTKSKDNIANSFNKNDYQKLFNVDDFGNEKLFINGMITNANSDLNYVELVMIVKKILNSYYLKNYKICIHDENIYNLVSYYINENVVLVPDGSNIIKVLSSNDQEIVNISKINNNITFNITIDKLVNYIIRENKESLAEETNKRKTLLYIRNQNEEDSKIFEKIYDSYLYKYKGIIVYEKDVKKDELYNYCIKNNLKLIVYFDDNNNYNLIDINDLLTNDIFTKPKVLTKKKTEEGEK